MVFQCQKQSYLKEFETTVVSCTPAELNTALHGKKETLKGFNVILEDTLLFPEGGGQAIKILGTEKGKKKKINLLFLVGNRVLKYAEKSLRVEKALTSLLKNGPEQHVEAVDRLQKSVKLLQKNNLSLLRDLALLTAKNFKSDPNKCKIFVLHRKEGDSEFMNIIANEIVTEVILLFLTVGDEKGAGLFLLAGQVDAVEALGTKVAGILDGKGAGKHGRYQGKANKMSRRPEVEALLQQYVLMKDKKEE
ncbi:alanyl-tRNA editing protein Aarsd1 [Mobula hypostoma]|uniref:alanyl-tRNA editing protein Aarsd1 n=1 Tax=Mobula hypostoma TaxID=723540 RepID=UPI002FC318D0